MWGRRMRGRRTRGRRRHAPAGACGVAPRPLRARDGASVELVPRSDGSEGEGARGALRSALTGLRLRLCVDGCARRAHEQVRRRHAGEEHAVRLGLEVVACRLRLVARALASALDLGAHEVARAARVRRTLGADGGDGSVERVPLVAGVGHGGARVDLPSHGGGIVLFAIEVVRKVRREPVATRHDLALWRRSSGGRERVSCEVRGARMRVTVGAYSLRVGRARAPCRK